MISFLLIKCQGFIFKYQFTMKEDEYEYENQYLYFADELQQITPRMIPSSFGNIYSLTAGTPGQPLILVVHGSGPKNSADEYAYFLHQYLVRISYIQKFYIVAIDCPGYGRSIGSKQAVKTFPLQLFKEILGSLRYKNYYAMMGHSQGGAAIFNAVHQDPTITEFLVMDRPVCGNIQRFRGFSLPTLLIYDIEDDGHPIWQGKLLYKELKHTQLYTYRNSFHQYWVPDHIWQKMLNFFSKQVKAQRKYHWDIEGSRKNKSESKQKLIHSSANKKGCISVDKIKQIKKKQKMQEKLVQIQEVQKSQLLSISRSQSFADQHQFEFHQQAKFYEKKVEQKERQPVYEEQKVQIFRFTQNKQQQTPSVINKVQTLKQEVKQIQNIVQAQQIKVKQPALTKQQLQNQNKCAICYQILYRPIVTNCNHMFCNKCILQSILVNQKCPLCRAKITKKTENKNLQQKLILQMSDNDIKRRENDFRRIQNMMKSIIYVEIGNHSRQLETKKSIFTKTKKKFIWQIFVKAPKNFPLQEVAFNINMGDSNAKPVRIKNAPYVFESRGTFSFACEITIKPRSKEYGELVSVYRIDVEPGTHSKIIALKKKCYQK